jgi:hypothetical protein
MARSADGAVPVPQPEADDAALGQVRQIAGRLMPTDSATSLANRRPAPTTPCPTPVYEPVHDRQTEPAAKHGPERSHQRAAGEKVERVGQPAVLVLDAFAVREFSPAETHELYELITARPASR